MSAPLATGRVDRRRLLSLLGTAPFALPAAASAAFAPEPFSSTIFVDVDWADYGRRCAAWFDANPDLAMPAEPNQQLAGIDALPQPHEQALCATESARADGAVPSRGLPVTTPRAFLDDVGSGP